MCLTFSSFEITNDRLQFAGLQLNSFWKLLCDSHFSRIEPRCSYFERWWLHISDLLIRLTVNDLKVHFYTQKESMAIYSNGLLEWNCKTLKFNIGVLDFNLGLVSIIPWGMWNKISPKQITGWICWSLWYSTLRPSLCTGSPLKQIRNLRMSVKFLLLYIQLFYHFIPFLFCLSCSQGNPEVEFDGSLHSTGHWGSSFTSSFLPWILVSLLRCHLPPGLFKIGRVG